MKYMVECKVNNKIMENYEKLSKKRKIFVIINNTMKVW